MKSTKNQKPKTMSIYIYTIYNNGRFVLNFLKLFMHYILSIFLIFCFFCNSYFVQLFICFNHCLFCSVFHPSNIYIYIYLQFSFDFLNLYFKFFSLYIFLNSTISLCSTFHLLPPFLFHLNFHINLFLLHFHVSPLFLLNYPR